MVKLNRSDEVNRITSSLVTEGKAVGLVPTMGALHEGHIELVKRAKKENDKVVCSIFVNPLQFNRVEDLESYPNRMKEDLALLKAVDCDIVFTPSREDLYNNQPDIDVKLGWLGETMEATKRPGHFEGVVAVIERLFAITNPSRAYFGEKDYQQLAVINWLVRQEKMNVEVVPCATVRNKKGLALSSRNYLLNENEIDVASGIYETLQFCKKSKTDYPPQQLAELCFKKLEREFTPEYFEIVDEATLLPIKNWEESNHPRAFVAAYLSKVRLIDNLSLIH